MNDDELTVRNHKLLSLTEHPVWGTFVKLVAEDLKELDSIHSLDMENLDRDKLVREVEVRYHTIEKIQAYLFSTIEKANSAQEDIEEGKSEIINIIN